MQTRPEPVAVACRRRAETTLWISGLALLLGAAVFLTTISPAHGDDAPSPPAEAGAAAEPAPEAPADAPAVPAEGEAAEPPEPLAMPEVGRLHLGEPKARERFIRAVPREDRRLRQRLRGVESRLDALERSRRAQEARIRRLSTGAERLRTQRNDPRILRLDRERRSLEARRHSLETERSRLDARALLPRQQRPLGLSRPYRGVHVR